MDSKATQNQSSPISVSAGPIHANDFYVLDFYGRFNSSNQKQILIKPGIRPDDASKAENEPAAQTGFLLSPSGQNYHQEHPESSLYGSKLLCQSTSPSSSSQYSSPPSSPTFTSVSSSPNNSPAYTFTSCSLPPPPDSLSPLITARSLHRPVIVPQSILPHMARDFTPPQSPVLALRQEPFPLPTQSTWRPWSWTLTTLGFSLYLDTAPMEKWSWSLRGTYVVHRVVTCHRVTPITFVMFSMTCTLTWLFIVLSNVCLH